MTSGQIASEVLWQSYILGAGFEPQSVINHQVEYFKELRPRFWFLTGSSRLKHLGRLMDAFISAGDFRKAEILLYATYADVIREQNLSLDEVFSLHVRAFQIMVAQRKTTELNELFDEIVKLDARGLRYNEPDTFLMAAKFTYALTTLGEFNYAESLGNIYQEFRTLNKDAMPKRAFMNFAVSENFIRAMRGQRPLADAFNWADSGAEKQALQALFNTFADLNIDRANRQENASQVDETLMLAIVDKNYDVLMTKFALAALLEHYAARNNHAAFREALGQLAQTVHKEMQDNNPLAVGKNLTFIDRNICDHALLATQALFGDSIPLGISNELMMLCTDWHTEIDVKARIKMVATKGVIDVPGELLNNRRINQEFGANFIWMAKEVTSIAVTRFDENDFKFLEPSETNAGFAFVSELQQHLKLHAFLADNSNFGSISNKQSYPSLEELSSRLNPDERLVILSRGHRFLLVCTLGQQHKSCSSDRLPKI